VRNEYAQSVCHAGILLTFPLARTLCLGPGHAQVVLSLVGHHAIQTVELPDAAHGAKEMAL
jgi:hypothetical protein